MSILRTDKRKKWSEQVTCRFIKEYRKHDCLWNANSTSYKNRASCTLAYQAMLYSLGIPELSVGDVKTKIKILRTTYSQEYRKIVESNRLGLPSYIPSLKWFPDMRHVMKASVRKPYKKLERPRKYFHSNTIIDEENTHEDLILINENLKNEHYVNNMVECEVPSEMIIFDNTNASSDPDEEHVRSKPALKQIDEFHHFGANVAAQLRTLPLEEALQAQLEIQSVLMKTRLHVDTDLERQKMKETAGSNLNGTIYYNGKEDPLLDSRANTKLYSELENRDVTHA